MRHFYLSILATLLTIVSYSQYNQNFDTLVTTTASATTAYDKLPQGWAIYEVGTGAQADGKYFVANGNNNTGNAYSFGTTNSTDRGLGTIASGTNFPTIGVIFFNESDTVINNVTITYTGEQWRYGGARPTTPVLRDTLRFEYSLNATGIVNNQGTWIRVNALDFLSIVATGPSAVVLDGNLPANRQTLTYTITGIAIQPGSSIVLRWSDENIAGNDDGLAVDDFSITGGFEPGQMSSGGTNTGGGTGGSGGTSNSSSTSTPVFPPKLQTDSAFLHLYGNLHGHTTHSDGNPSTGQPKDAYNYAKSAIGMDFLGISEHNHSTAGMQIADYKIGSQQADSVNGTLNSSGLPFIALHGMEWGTISTGGHVLVYGFSDSLINWEPGNYDILVQKGDYMSLFDSVRKRTNAFATLAHPNTSDYTGLTGGYKGVADSAVVSLAIESGPAFSTSTTYTDFPSSLAYITYYRNLLKRGYRVGAQMDQDNHNMTFGTANQNRMVVLSADRTREALVRGIIAMRVYASNDLNARINFSINNFIIGSSINAAQPLVGSVTYTDLDLENIMTIQVYAGKVGGTDPTVVHTATTNTTFPVQPVAGETWYYYVILTQNDGGKMTTSPIWVTGALNSPLPVGLVNFDGRVYNQTQSRLTWETSFEQNSDYFEVERSSNGRDFTSIGKVAAQSQAGSYSFIDHTPLTGINYYRLRAVDKDGSFKHSKIISVEFKAPLMVTVYPNPTKGRVQIKLNKPTTAPVIVHVIDIAGNLVYNKLHTGNNFSLDLSKLASGSYLIRVGEEVQQLQIVK